MLIVHESAESTPRFAQLVTSLREPPHAEYFKAQGHVLAVLDDDSVDETGQPSAILESWRPHFADLTLPAVILYDPATQQLVHKQPLATDAKAEDVIAIVKEHGG